MAYLGLGSNVGDRRGFIGRAIELLDRAEGVRVCRRASLYESEPVGVEDQRWFLNTVVEVETSRSPRALLGLCQEIEARVGRVRVGRARWGPREIDLDILLYGDRIIEEEGLVIPHREMVFRKFVLVPLAELAEGLLYPVTGRPIRELLAALEGRDSKVVRRWTVRET